MKSAPLKNSHLDLEKYTTKAKKPLYQKYLDHKNDPIFKKRHDLKKPTMISEKSRKGQKILSALNYSKSLLLDTVPTKYAQYQGLTFQIAFQI